MSHYNQYQIDRAKARLHLDMADASADIAAYAFLTIEEQHAGKVDQLECEVVDLHDELAEAHITIRQHEGRIDEMEEAMEQAVSQLAKAGNIILGDNQ